MEWISVKDRLPDTDGEYLCTWNGYIGVLIYDREQGYFHHNKVTHWMPLPELPKGE